MYSGVDFSSIQKQASSLRKTNVGAAAPTTGGNTASNSPQVRPKPFKSAGKVNSEVSKFGAAGSSVQNTISSLNSSRPSWSNNGNNNSQPPAPPPLEKKRTVSELSKKITKDISPSPVVAAKPKVQSPPPPAAKPIPTTSATKTASKAPPPAPTRVSSLQQALQQQEQPSPPSPPPFVPPPQNSMPPPPTSVPPPQNSIPPPQNSVPPQTFVPPPPTSVPPPQNSVPPQSFVPPPPTSVPPPPTSVPPPKHFPPPSAKITTLPDEPEDVYDDIQEYQAEIQKKKAATTLGAAGGGESSLIEKEPSPNSTNSDPPPLPPPNNPPPPSPTGGVFKSVSIEALHHIEASSSVKERISSTYSSATQYNSSTLPTKGHHQSMMRRAPVDQRTSSLQPPVSAQTTYKEMEEPMGLGDFAKKHQNRFPIQMKMCSSHDGVVSVNEGDIYNVHFMKQTDVVSLTASGGTQYFVPLNSAVEFGVVYNPTNKLQDALQGFVFATAGEIMSGSCSTPPILFTQKSCEISSQDSSVQAGDVLVVNEIKSKLLRGKMLLCTDVRTEQKKRLLDNCCGDFSTTPSQVKLFLPQLLRHIPLPQYCVLFYSGQGGAQHEDISAKLPRGIVELTRTTTQQSLIVSKAVDSSNSQDSNVGELLEFPFTNNIMAQLVQPNNETISQNLIVDTKHKYETFNPAAVQSMSMMLTMENPYTLSKQVAILSATRQGKANASVGVKLIRPDSINTAEPHPSSTGTYSATTIEEDDVEDDPDYQLPSTAMEQYAEAKKKLSVAPPVYGSKTPPVTGSKSHYDTPKSALSKVTKPAIPTTGPPAPPPQPAPSSTATKHSNDDEEEDLYDIPCISQPINPGKLKLPSAGPAPPPTPPPNNNPYGTNVPTGSAIPFVKPVETRQQQHSENSSSLQKEVSNLKDEVKGLKTNVEKLDTMCKGLATTVASLQAELRSVKGSLIPSKAIPDTPEENISLLQSLTLDQVLHLIKELNLSEYSSIFQKEQIDGSLLSECDEEVLMDLGISSKLHRMRLASVIAGKTPVRQLIEKDPYVKCFK